MTDRYAVVGHPVAHSLSPAIHAAFARASGEDIVYERILAPLDGFADTVTRFRAQGGRGLNVTLPFKHEAWALADAHAGYAGAAGAVNTLEFRDGRAIGHNTDGIGLVTDLERNLAFPLAGRRVLVLGAGGASCGVLQPLIEARPARIVVANRTLQRAAALVERFGALTRAVAGGVQAGPFESLAGLSFDLVLNATSAGLQNAMPPVPPEVFAPGALAYDMVYGRETPFLAFARACGARTADGLGMLVEQAAESFRIWRGVRPPTQPVIDRLRAGAS